MSQIKISSTGWLAICFRNGATGVFDLNDTRSWQYLKTESIVDQSKNDDTNEFNRNLIKFSPNGQSLVFNAQSKQLNVYIQSDFEKTEVWWELQQIIVVKNPISSLELNNEFLLIADINGDVYQVDLSFNDKNQNLIITAENCIMRNISMLHDIAFIHINDKKSFLLTGDQDDKIRLSHYPNIFNIEGHCFGHTEFVSHIKLIDNNHILSASGDGTLRLWRLPDCVPLVLLHSKAFTLLSKQVFYTQLYNSNFVSLENYRTDSMPEESLLDSSSIIDYSIWKMDVACYNSNIYIAFSIYAHRSHSIYLTSLSNIKKLANEQRKLTLDIGYGKIVDYCFPSKDILLNDYITNSKCYLYILFDSNILIKVDIISVLLFNQTELFVPSDQTIQDINNILTRKEFHLMDLISNNTISDEIIFKQLFKKRTNSNDSSGHKRKMERIEEEQRKKQVSSQDEDDATLAEYF